jgi:hypothetical protein
VTHQKERKKKHPSNSSMKKKMQRFEDTSLKVWAVISKTSPQIV